ncbi:DUF3558 domain-containing protein [Streptomyces sp. NPDC052701]|uniref:DUF3558 domain-containing protein n=1 Tax=Streptomyces sp. NPDC052701 TaxID=3155533 RepID=UPI00344A81FF
MQRKAYVSGVAALLAALLTGCTGGSGDDGATDDADPGDVGQASAAARPGKYRTLPEPCGAVGRESLDELLPGVRQMTDEEQREKAYAGQAILTYDTDRKVGCRWKVESAQATDHLFVGFERVVSYDSAVSDDSEAGRLFAVKEADAHLPEPTVTESAVTDTGSPDDPAASPSASASSAASGSRPASPPADSSSDSPSSSSPSSPSSPSSSDTPAELQPRVLEDLGDEAFLDDELSSSGSTAERRTVTVAFRTSNVIVTIEYAEQPATVGVVPDSGEMQDRALELASRLADSLSG